MELKDSAYRNVVSFDPYFSVEEGFKDIDAAILVGARPRGPGMERKDLLEANAKIFEEQGKALDRVAKKTVKVLVVGNPANTNCLIASSFAPSIPKSNFTAMTRLDHNRATGVLAEKLGVGPHEITQMVIWGNHSSTQFADTSFAQHIDLSVRQLIDDDTYLDGPFLKQIAGRGAEIISVMSKSSAASAASAACDHMHDWWFGTAPNDWTSMGVISDTSAYGIDTDLCFSYPVTIENGTWKIVEGLKLNQFQTQKLHTSEQELQEERKLALNR